MSKYNSFAFLTCALPSQVGNWVHMQPEVWNWAKTRLICHFYLAQILCALCANFSLQHSELFRALCAIPYIAVLGIGLRFVSLFSRCSTRNWRAGRNAKIFHLCAPAALLGIPSLPFFDISKNSLCTSKRYQCVGAWQRITAKACLLILRGIFLEGLKVFWRIPQKCFLEKLRLKTNQLCF